MLKGIISTTCNLGNAVMYDSLYTIIESPSSSPARHQLIILANWVNNQVLKDFLEDGNDEVTTDKCLGLNPDLTI